ncbi:MAG TPA: hypothetical protein VJ305_11040 [Streptosporangiaceae bacterium]|jgi:hypothetical protein|nr:hypothetical protein [Streptosporangiaceae bacterium]
MFSVPPTLGVPALADGDPDPDEVVDEELHAASPAAASTATASVARRFGALIMGMFLW